jgi:hypothetical protein
LIENMFFSSFFSFFLCMKLFDEGACSLTVTHPWN